MAMDKYGVNPNIEHQGLRDEEAQLMTKVAAAISSGDHEEAAKIEPKLQRVRSRLTELDLAQKKDE